MTGLEKRIRNSFVGTIISRTAYLYYTRLFTPVKAFIVRRQSKIKVAFVITELGTWKSEALYLKMLEHPRFEPMIMVLQTPENPDAMSPIINYLESRRFGYRALGKTDSLQKQYKADIIFYPKPYMWTYFPGQNFYGNRYALLCYIVYGFHNIVSDYICNQPYHNYVWQCYFENQSAADDTARVMDNKGRNIRVTGLPMEDSFRLPKDSYKDVWRKQSKHKKRIIWAPHFSFAKDSVLKYSTFLEYYEIMLTLVEKYSDQVQFAFKPHPLLRTYLNDYWGKDRTDAYFGRWACLPNAQIETGQYIDLFMTSDAMIHDCSSFTNEYMYTCKPVMYLIRGSAEEHCLQLNTHSKKAFNLHYFGRTADDIEKFIFNVINGIDPYKESRDKYYRDYLSPINGKSACDNIIESILGE
ncbi:MAG: CDP-glycerol glycerophosphotransferase family protein [Candidatus Cryptobacteroides sp.]